MASSIAIASSGSMASAPQAAALVPARRKRRKYRCGCVTREGCHVCGGCVEKHCSCGEPDRRNDRKLCLESRACNCIKLSPASNCPLCHGCRQPSGLYSHCRCIQHQQQRKLSQAQLDAAIEDGSHVKYCSCIAFPRKKPALANTVSRSYGVDEDQEEEVRKPKLQTRIRRIQRAAGVPTAGSIYDRKITTSFSDPEDSEEDQEIGLNGGEAVGQDNSQLEEMTADRVLPKLIMRKQFRDVFPPPYQPLLLDRGTSMLESLEPQNGRMRTGIRSKVNRQQLIERGLENYIYALDREENKPSDDLVDYLIYLASLKVSNVPELVGTLDDTAAVATAIVMEEYMTQLVNDFTEQQQPLCAVTQASVEAFAHQLLFGFNWKLFKNQCGREENAVGTSDEFALEQGNLDSLASIIYLELLATQNDEAQVLSDLMETQAIQWIREVVSKQYEASTKPNALVQRSDDDEDTTSSMPSPFVRLGVYSSALAGTPVYNFSVQSLVADGQRVSVTADGIETREMALERIQRVKNTLEQAQSRHEESMKQQGRWHPSNLHTVKAEPEESKQLEETEEDPEKPFEDPAVESLYQSLSSGITKYLSLRGEYELVQTTRQLEKLREKEELAQQKREKIERMRMEWAEKEPFEAARKKALKLVEKELKSTHGDYLTRRRLQIIKLCHDRELILSEEMEKAADEPNDSVANAARIKELHLLQEKRLLLEDDIEKEKREKEMTDERYEQWRLHGRPLTNPNLAEITRVLTTIKEQQAIRDKQDMEEQEAKELKRKQREEARQAKSGNAPKKKKRAAKANQTEEPTRTIRTRSMRKAKLQPVMSDQSAAESEGEPKRAESSSAADQKD